MAIKANANNKAVLSLAASQAIMSPNLFLSQAISTGLLGANFVDLLPSECYEIRDNPTQDVCTYVCIHFGICVLFVLVCICNLLYVCCRASVTYHAMLRFHFSIMPNTSAFSNRPQNGEVLRQTNCMSCIPGMHTHTHIYIYIYIQMHTYTCMWPWASLRSVFFRPCLRPQARTHSLVSASWTIAFWSDVSQRSL